MNSKLQSGLNYRLKITIAGSMSEMAHLMVCNGYLDIVHGGYGSCDLRLPKGIYTFVVSLNEIKEERTVSLDKDVYESYELPGFYSAIPAFGISNFSEDVTEAAERYSIEPTVGLVDGSLNSSLFIFLSKIEMGNSSGRNPSLGRRLLILDRERRKIYALDKKLCVKKHGNQDWLAFHVKIPKGLYYLHYVGGRQSDARELPIYVFEGWQTQVFLGVAKTPRFSSLRIRIAKDHQGFDRNASSSLLMEAVLLKAQNGIFHFPFEDLWELAVGKWEDPMKGLLAIHMFLAGKPDVQFNHQMVISNLSDLLGRDCPDIRALNVMLAQKLGLEEWDMHIDEPCMFFAGMLSAVRGINGNQIIVAESAAEKILEELYSDLIWTSYKPEPINREFDQIFEHIKYAGYSLPDLNEVDTESFVTNFENEYKSYSISSLRLPTPKKPAILNSWVANLILEEVLEEANAKTVTELSAMLRLTPTLVDKTLKNLILSKTEIIEWSNSGEIDIAKEYISEKNFTRLGNLKR